MAAELKTKPTAVSVEGFLKKVADPEQRADSFVLLEMMKEITGMKPRMWGPTMVGFGEYHYKYASGHEGDCFQMGFSPRKGQMSLYFMPGFDCIGDLLKKLGKHKTGKSCLYIKKLADVDQAVLRQMMEINMERVTDLVQETKEAAAAPKKKPTAKKPTAKKKK